MTKPTLELLKEHKLHALLAGFTRDDRLEASGVCVKDGLFHVIFDNSPHIARLDATLTVGHPRNTLLRQRGESSGFEDITYHERARRFLIIIEASLYAPGVYKPRIEEYDDDLRFIESNWVDFAFPRPNKGIEGLNYVPRGEQDYVLGLCEGNRGRGGKAGRKPGGGRLQVFQKGAGQWEHVDTIRLPKSVRFEDYASFDVVEERIAVVSQVSSRLWVSAFRPGTWEFADEGAVYDFPRNAQGQRIYGNIEGIGWLGPTQIVVVSDRRKPGEQPKRHAEKDQSIHVFQLPERVP